MPVTVVLNSYHFLDDIVPAILSEEAEQTSQTSGVTQYPLFEAIENGRHTIITTAKIREREYFKEAEDRNLSAFLPQIYDQLEVKNILKNKTVRRVQISFAPKRHKVFLQDAIAAQVDYLVTQFDRLLNLQDQVRRIYDIKVVDAGRFLREIRHLDQQRNRPR